MSAALAAFAVTAAVAAENSRIKLKSVFLIIVLESRLNSLFSKNGAVNFCRRKSVKSFNNCFVAELESVLNLLSLYHFGSDRACCNS